MQVIYPFSLRPYQKECIDAVMERFNTASTALVQLPTAAGKTIIFSELVKKCLQINPEFSCIIIVPKNILIIQTKKKLEQFIDGEKIGIFCAEYRKKEIGHQIILASIQSLSKISNLPLTKMMIFDEVHWANMEEDKSHKKVYKRAKFINPNLKLLGMTATPIQHGQMMFGEDKFWDKPVYKKTIRKMTDEGYLCPMIFQTTHDQINLTGVKKSGDDYNQVDLANVILSDSDKIDAQVKDALEKSKDRNKIIWMCVSIEHAEAIHARIPDSTIIHSKKKDRDDDIDFFKEFGRHLISVLVASEGFDYPEADCLVLMRPTRSVRLYIQAAGRVLRPHPSKESALLLDYGRVVENLGDIYNIKLDESKPKIKMCSGCCFYSSQGTRVCPHCGDKFMTMCSVCMMMKPYGESCCSAEAKRDQLKNTTLSAYQNISIENISTLNFKVHKAKKSGNYCLKIDYIQDLFGIIISEYYPDWKFQKLIVSTLGDYEEMTFEYFIENYSKDVPVPIAIEIDKSEEWDKITKKIYSNASTLG